jgi:hypothetical protein
MTTSDFASLYRLQVKALFAARKELKGLAELAPPILATLPDGPIGPIDPRTGLPAGANIDITKADLAAAVRAAGELETHLTAADGTPTPTNLALQKVL